MVFGLEGVEVWEKSNRSGEEGWKEEDIWDPQEMVAGGGDRGPWVRRSVQSQG